MKFNDKKKYILFMILVLLLIFVYIINNKNTADLKTIINNDTHSEKSINEVVELIIDDFKTNNFKADILIIEYDEKNSNKIETTLKKEYDASEALEFNVSFKTWLFTNQELNGNEVYIYRFDYVKKNGEWILVNYGQG